MLSFQLRHFLITFLGALVLCGMSASSAWAQDAAADAAVDAAAADGGGGDAAAAGGGGGGGGIAGVSGFQAGFGIMYASSIGKTSQTLAVQGGGFTPRGFLRANSDGWALQVEYSLFSFNVDTPANDGTLSSNKIAQAELSFVGQAYMLSLHLGDETLGYYVGSGAHTFQALRSQSKKTANLAAELDRSFVQKVSPQTGSQFVVGAETQPIEHLLINLEWRALNVPVDVETEIRDLETSEISFNKQSFDLLFPMVMLGLAYIF